MSVVQKLKEKAHEYAETLKEIGEGLQALRGKKPLRSKVAILANPDDPQSMSILTKGEARFVSMAYYANSVDEWGGIFQGLQDRANAIMRVSPSISGEGREQVIRFVGALTESKLFKELNIAAQKQEQKGG